MTFKLKVAPGVQLFHITIMDAGVILVFAVVFLISYLFLSKRKNLPPGPLNFPIIGSVHVMRAVRKKRPHEALTDLSKEYGPVYSFKIGKQQFVVVNGFDAIHETLVKRSDLFSDRPTHLQLVKYLTKNGNGVILSDYNHSWKVLRRFTLQALRDFGVGKSSLEEKINTEIEATSKRFIEIGDRPIDMDSSMQNLVGNIIYGIVFGMRFEYDDPDFKKVRLLTDTALSGDGAFNLSALLPKYVFYVIKLFSRQITTETRLSNADMIDEFLMRNVKEHVATFDENNIRDFVDLHIQTAREHAKDETTAFTDGELFRVINDLFLAGLITTSTTLDWAFLFMSEFPDVQKKCQDEIEEMVGDKPILYADRDKLPYLNSTLMEVQRMASIAPLSVSHTPKVDAELLGYTIPANTVVIPNLYSAVNDPKHWTEPEKSKADRFLDEKGKLKKVPAFIPFSTGPRQCLGEPLAKMELFMVFANMLQRFKFLRENENVQHSLQSRTFQATNSPLPYKLRVKSRK